MMNYRKHYICSQPVGFVDSIFLHHVCLLHKSFYGLKQAPRALYDRLTSYLLTLGFNMSPSNDPLLLNTSLHFESRLLRFLIFLHVL